MLPLNLICGGIDTAIGIAVRQKKINAYRVNSNIVFHENDVSSNIYNPSVPQKKLHSSAIRDWPNFS